VRIATAKPRNTEEEIRVETHKIQTEVDLRNRSSHRLLRYFNVGSRIRSSPKPTLTPTLFNNTPHTAPSAFCTKAAPDDRAGKSLAAAGGAKLLLQSQLSAESYKSSRNRAIPDKTNPKGTAATLIPAILLRTSQWIYTSQRNLCR
jgi:hypothetical protein